MPAALPGREVAELVDIANEPDTTPWYARRLRRAASALVGRLAPMTLLVHGAGPKAIEGSEWNAITEEGTFALAAWSKRWGIADAKFVSLNEELDDGDHEDKDLAPEDRPGVDDDLTRTLDRRLELMGLLCRRMLLQDLALRLVIQDFNDRKHTAPFREEEFGYPGSRIDGRPTIGSMLDLAISPFVQRVLERWPALNDDDRASLRCWLQEAVGEERAYIEDATIENREDTRRVEVKLRLPIHESEDDVRQVLAPAAETWLRRHVGGLDDVTGGAAS